MAEARDIELAQTLPGQAAPRELVRGDRVGEYEVVRLIGGGAMGDVYEGKHPVIGKKVAIKVIKQVLASSEEAAQRFIREAQASSQIDHPNVLDVFAFGRLPDGRLYLVMDLLEGCSLDEHLRRRGKLSVQELLEIMEPTCAAVEAAHDAGIVHRDLKPANVFLAHGTGERPSVFVLDFGVARLMSTAQEQTGQTLTGQGVWIGTPAYMAPEQWTSEGANSRSDIYALGAMSYELLTGSSPFVADSIPGVMEKHFHSDIPGLKDSGVSLPGHIEAALRKAMAKAPDDRFASAGELLQALRGKLRVTAPARAGGSAARPAILPIAIGAALVLVAVASLVILRTSAEPTTTAAGREPATARTEEMRTLIDTVPSGAAVERAGVLIGTTPVCLAVCSGADASIKLRKPGYVSREATPAPGERTLTLELTPIVGFEGVWRMPDGALRRFSRDNERVAAYKLDSARAAGTFYRFFSFVDSGDDAVVFEASAEHVDEQLPNEPSCRLALAAQYRFDPTNASMALRKEKVAYDKVDGRCVVSSRGWSDYEPVARIELGDPDHLLSVESLAGAVPNAPIATKSNTRKAAKNAAPAAKDPIAKRKPVAKLKAPAKERPTPKEDIAQQRKAPVKEPPAANMELPQQQTKAPAKDNREIKK